jgi:probable HAF family extracellular repeat protein
MSYDPPCGSGGQVNGFIYQNGVFTNIDVPGAHFSQPTAINNKGVVAGSYATSNGIGHGFLYKDGKFTTVDYPDTIDTGLFGINDKGVIVGFRAAPHGQFKTFQGIPIRNPSQP